ncbi:S-layer homology domain-containing protein, partial [Paenibacillus sepulcri]|nr:S-layer homology domain-containing protein [Paenibacillus sepulcri]
SLTITAADGTTGKLTQLDEPVTISLKVDDSINPRLAGIYFIPDEGRLEYIGGEYADGRLTAQIHHLSKYAVLEVKRDFSDLSAGHWAYNVIEELAAKQIVQGTSGMLFEPGRPITRSEFTAMLVHALKLSKQGEVKFADVTEGDWYREAVSIAYEAGIVTGRSAGTFDPEALITREEMVTMLMKAHKLLPDAEVTPSVPALFADSSEISAWAAQYVQEAAELHLIRGRAEGIFEPKGISTRAEAAQVLYNLISP